jgi:hypothetical protein
MTIGRHLPAGGIHGVQAHARRRPRRSTRHVAPVNCWAAFMASSVKRLMNVPSDEQPTAKQTLVTLRPENRFSAPNCSTKARLLGNVFTRHRAGRRRIT